MSLIGNDRFDRNSGALEAEETLRMIASLPAPEGLEDRVKARLHSSPRGARVVAWPFASADHWMRAAAAAAIVTVIAGGGWGVYSHIQVAPLPAAMVEQQNVNGEGHFSTAGAKHVPQTLDGPVVTSPVVEEEKQKTEIVQPDTLTKQKAQKSASGSPASQKPIK